MNILLDFIAFQSQIGGAASFAKAVYDEICHRRNTDDHLYATYDATLHKSGQYDYKEYAQQHGILLLDLSTATISHYVTTHSIDVFFIAIGQFYEKYSLDSITCKVVMGIHDIWDVERQDNGIELTINDKLAESRWQWTKRMLNVVSGRFNRRQRSIYQHIMPLYASPNTLAFTVSDYSRNALTFYFPELSEKQIAVFYSPARNTTMQPEVENESLRQLIDSGKPYLLMLAANRRFKNAHTLIKVYKRLLTDYPDLHLLTLKYDHTVHPQHIDIPFLSDSDLEHAYKHAQCLVFGSFFEGFGYPPIEALRHGTPTVASNVTSIPEILGDAGIYFSPFYTADLYRALRLVLSNRDIRRNEMEQQLKKICSRQKDDLQRLVGYIMDDE